MTVSAFGDRAAIVQLPSMLERDAMARHLQSTVPDAVVRCGLVTVLVERRHPDPGLLAEIIAAVAGVDRAPRPSLASDRVVTIEVDYSGDDLAEAAALLDCGPRDVVRAHVSQTWTVAMMGFAPGFGYLVPIGDASLDWSRLPRRATPRAQVPAGGVAVAAGMSAVYPASMPGGWHVIGTTTSRLFDVEAVADPTLLHPGDSVRFTEAKA